MNIDKRQGFSLLTLILILLPIFYISFSMSSQFQQASIQDEKFGTKLKTSQVPGNFTVAATLHKLIWIEGQLTLILTANESGLISCEFKDSQDGLFFTSINKMINLTGNSVTQTVHVTFIPLLTTLPGNYDFTLEITGFYEYSESFEIILGMGYVIFLLIISIFGIGVIIILAKKGGEKLVKSVVVVPDDSIPSDAIDVPISKISCPECKKLINEGLTFCPECGSRIPEFLRFNPNSPSGL